MLTPEQNAIVKAYVEADQYLNSFPHNTDGAFGLAGALNQPSADFIVWKSSVSQDEIMQNGFDWTRVDNLSVGKARIWEWLFKNQSTSFNPAKPNVRAGIEAAWVGTAADLLVRAAVYTHCKRTSTILEQILATGTGTDAVPATMGYEGNLSYSDAFVAMGW
jgi:hypothetical protein